MRKATQHSASAANSLPQKTRRWLGAAARAVGEANARQQAAKVAARPIGRSRTVPA